MRSNQAELKNAVHAMQSKLDALTARVNEAEKIISDLEDGLMERKEIEENREKQPTTHEERLREFNDTLERTNIRIIRTKKGGLEGIFDQIMAENSPNLGKETCIHVQEAEKTPPQIKKNRSTP